MGLTVSCWFKYESTICRPNKRLLPNFKYQLQFLWKDLVYKVINSKIITPGNLNGTRKNMD